jgi:ubiquinone/menaquinone biosynthesis C-methylase UbiE
VDLDEFRAASLDRWSRSAVGWGRHAERVDDWGEAATEWVLAAAALRPGQRVLELACGPAGVGLRAARLVEPGGVVICSDFAEPMLEVARERARDQGIQNVEFRVIDGEDIDLPDGGLDAVLCRFGFMLMTDPAAALSEARRVLRAAGRVALVVWSEDVHNPWASLPMRTLMAHLQTPEPEPGTPGMFALSDPDRLRGLIEGAGFSDVEIEPLRGAHRYGSFAEWWDLTRALARPFDDATANMPDPDREAIRARMRREAERYATDDGSLDFPAEMLVAAGTAA